MKKIFENVDPKKRREMKTRSIVDKSSFADELDAELDQENVQRVSDNAWKDLNRMKNF